MYHVEGSFSWDQEREAGRLQPVDTHIDLQHVLVTYNVSSLLLVCFRNVLLGSFASYTSSRCAYQSNLHCHLMLPGTSFRTHLQYTSQGSSILCQFLGRPTFPTTNCCNHSQWDIVVKQENLIRTFFFIIKVKSAYLASLAGMVNQ